MGREHLIRCPTFVCSTVGDDLSATAETFADQLRCPKGLRPLPSR
jgi:hypothetical protein